MHDWIIGHKFVVLLWFCMQFSLMLYVTKMRTLLSSVLNFNLTYWEEALDSLSVVHGEGVRGDGGGGDRQLHLGQRADPLPHLLPGRHGLAVPIEGARDKVSDLVFPPLSLPEQETLILLA